MFHVVLYEPEIPPNTGNIIRLCANTGAALHLIKPLGFQLEDKQLKRAGLDYHEWANLKIHEDFAAFKRAFVNARLFPCTTKGSRYYSDFQYQTGDVFLFGPESRGLPKDILEQFSPDQRIKIPMRSSSRSLNLSNAVAVIVYEAWRQLGFS